MKRGRTHARLKQMREEAFARQGGACYWCDEPMLMIADQSDPRLCTAEHVVRQVEGGPTSRWNIVAACRECNNSRHRPQVKRHHKS